MIKKAIHAVAWRSEKLLDLLRGPAKRNQADKRLIIEPYAGYATPAHLVVRGRVLTALRRNSPLPTQSRWLNFRQMLSLFLTDEVASVEVTAEGASAVTDEEGYFTLLLPRPTITGWTKVEVTIPGRAGSTQCPVLIAGEDARFAVISDIDDTMLETGAYSIARNLWTTFTGNAQTRRIFPDAVTFIEAISEDGRNPIYYVSSSPWNLHWFLQQVFEAAGLRKGPAFLRDLGLSKTQFVTGTHGDHKGGSINVLMLANPELSYVLVGDTGQHDTFVYLDMIRRYPDRVLAVVVREPGPGPDARTRAAMDEIRATGTALLHGRDFSAMAETLLALADQGRSGTRP